MKPEVIIIGGGPAGSTMGCYLSRLGIPNLILDSALHPREHVGESMVTATTRIFEEIGFLGTMEREGFVRKYGASWHPTAGTGNIHVDFGEIGQEGINQDYTYHVDRSRFDHLLLQHAELLGSEVRQGTAVREVIFENGRACGVRISANGNEQELTARLVIDASGRRTLLGSQLGLKRLDPNFNQFALHSWFEGVDRGSRPNDIHIYFLPLKRGWVWQIPITEAITSVGVVVEKNIIAGRTADLESLFHELATTAPDIARALEGARAIRPFKIEADYSYQMDRFVGDGWMLVGDAARFVDPIFSSGVSVAMHSAKFASEQVARAFDSGDLTREALRPYEERLKAGTAIWYEFIVLYYKLRMVFTVFMAKKDHRLQVIQLLQGDVYDRSKAPVLKAMHEFVATVEKTDGHLFQQLLDPDLNPERITEVRAGASIPV